MQNIKYKILAYIDILFTVVDKNVNIDYQHLIKGQYSIHNKTKNISTLCERNADSFFTSKPLILSLDNLYKQENYLLLSKNIENSKNPGNTYRKIKCWRPE